MPAAPDPVLQVPSPLTELVDDRLGSVRMFLKRDDLIHPELPGNKWRKLKYLLDDARATGTTTLLAFGGAYSNLIRAVAAAGRIHGLATIGVIRGEERPTNDGLVRAQADGMRLHYLDRATYRRKADPDVLEELHRRFGDFYLVPEGGSTVHGIRGCVELVDELDVPFDLIACAVGTGGTLAGLAAGLRPGQSALGISVLRGEASLEGRVRALHEGALGRSPDNWRIDHRFHCGGFARRNPELDGFLAEFHRRHGLALDRVYVGKLLLGLFSLVDAGEIVSGSTVVAVVTGPAE
jgi:1-aminocyclopropane-1-carboxylate deaminase